MDIDYADRPDHYDHADKMIAWTRTTGSARNGSSRPTVFHRRRHTSGGTYIQGTKARRQDRHRRTTIMVSADTFGKIFNEGTEFQRGPGRRSMRCFKDGILPIGTIDSFCHVYAAVHPPGLHGACKWATRLYRRYAVHARWRVRPVPISPVGGCRPCSTTIQKVLSLPDDYAPCSCAHVLRPQWPVTIAWETTVAKSKANIHSCWAADAREDFHQVPHRA